MNKSSLNLTRPILQITMAKLNYCKWNSWAKNKGTKIKRNHHKIFLLFRR